MTEAQTEILDRVRKAQYGSDDDFEIQQSLAALGSAPAAPLDFDNVLESFLLRLSRNTASVDFAANRLPDDKSFPVGTDIEVCSFAALERAWIEATEQHEREHVMPYLYEDPARFNTLLVRSDQDYSQYRWTVDTEEDLELVRRVFAYFGGRNDFGWTEILNLFEAQPQLSTLNASVEHKSQFDVDSGWSGA